MTRLLCLCAVLLSLIFPACAEPVKTAGIIKGPDGKPVAGATVTVLSVMGQSETAQHLTSDAAGHFDAMVEPPATIFKLKGRKILAWALIESPGFAVSGGLMGEGDNAFTLEAAHSVAGRVVDEAGAPIAGVKVRLSRVQAKGGGNGLDDGDIWIGGANGPVTGVEERYSSRTDAAGKWTIEGVPGRGMATVSLSDPRFMTASSQIPLGAIAAEPAKIVAKPGASLSGRVLGDDGQPAPGVSVTAQSADPNGEGYAQATTGADGTFTLSGLRAGRFKISVQGANGARGQGGETTRVAAQVEATATLGQTAPVPEIRFVPGLVVEGTVIEAKTKKPLSGATVSAWGEFGSSLSAASDEKGVYRLRVLPGEVGIYLSSPPKGYVSDGDRQVQLTVSPARHTLPPLTVVRALTLSGVAVDEKGLPAAGVVIASSEREWDSVTATSNDAGQWTLEDVSPVERNYSPTRPLTKITLAARGEWQIVSGGAVALPLDGKPIRVVLKPLVLGTLEVRVVSPQTEVLPGVLVKYTIVSPDGSRQMKQSTTDAAGRFHIADLRPEQTVELKAEKEGYAPLSGGVVERRDGKLSASDIVLAPLNGRFAGLVTQDGVPSPNALAAPLEALDLRDEGARMIKAANDGRFTLDGLPQGELEVMAAKGRTFGKSKIAPGGEATVALSPGSDGPSRQDIWPLVEGWKVSDKNRDWQRQRMARELALVDPDRALQWAAKPDGGADDVTIGVIIAQLARRDALQAASWGPGQIEKMKPGNTRRGAMLSLALGVLSVDPDLAKQLYERAASEAKPDDFGREAASLNASQAALAARLGADDADFWMQAMQLAAERSIGKKEWDDAFPALVAQMAPGGAALVEQAVAPLAVEGQVNALAASIPVVARFDLPGARRLMEALEKLLDDPALPTEDRNDNGSYHPSARQTFERTAARLATIMAPTDAPGALALARKIKRYTGDKGEVMALAARHLKGDAQTTAFREAMAAAEGEYQGVTKMSRVAALARESNPALSEEFFKRARERLARKSRFGEDEDYYGQRDTPAGYAFYRAEEAPEEARLLLENFWARRVSAFRRKAAAGDKTANSPDMGWQVSYQLKPVVQAMAVLDWTRALEMMREVETLAGPRGNSFDLPPLLLHALLLPSDQRRIMSFEQGLSDEEF